MSTKQKHHVQQAQAKNGWLPNGPRQMVTWASMFVFAGAASFTSARAAQCRSFPGDKSWPLAKDWDAFNKTVGGRLIATPSIGAVCHDTFPGVEYDAQKCAEVQDLWPKPELHEVTTHSTMAAIWANISCDPFTARDAPCSVGTYVQYAVKATGADDYRKTIAFAADKNIRLVIRNTGHDYMGKSTGAGSLALWTHHIKDKSIINYKSNYYTGKALKMGAGVSAGEAQALANSEGLLVVDGDCPTVGIAGGYLQGGESSPLASRFGLGVDSVLEWEVVTADGKLVTATPTNQYSDLYWALSGGGGGTFGAVLSVTIYFPGGTIKELERLLDPTFKALKSNEIQYGFAPKDFSNYQDAFVTLNPYQNITEFNIGGRLIPKSLVANRKSADSLANAIEYITANGGIFAGISADVSKGPSIPNSAHPAWRKSAFLAFYGIPYDRTSLATNVASQKVVTTMFTPRLQALTPGCGAYLNEADVNEPK
ncbi:hypothetical protein V8F06_014113 [Rhypophila decipiens]